MTLSLSLFDIPHIRDDIARYLSTNELGCCVLASKEWSTWFSPSLWHSVDIQFGVVHKFGISTLKRHRDYIRSILIGNRHLVSVAAGLHPFPRLNSLAFDDHFCDESALLDFIAAVPSLRRLKLTIQCFQPNNYEKFIQILALLPNMEQLDLTVRKVDNPLFLPRLLQACKRYRALRFHPMLLVEVPDSDSGNAGDQQEAGTAERLIQDVQCQDLSIYLPVQKQGHITIFQVLRHFPLLEHLELVSCRSEELQQVSRLWRENFFPILKHVCLINSPMIEAAANRRIKDSIMDFILATGSPQRSFEDSTARDTTSNPINPGLKSFQVKSLWTFDRQIAKALFEGHANTLTVLDLSCSFATQLPLFMYAISNLPQLLSLIANISLSPEAAPNTNNTIAAGETPLSPWSCLGLKAIELRVTLLNCVELSVDNTWNSSVEHLNAGYLFGQIGRMKNLREWKLRCKLQLLKIEKGYLEQLSGLNQLRYLEIGTSMILNLGEREADWIVENWTRLVQVNISIGTNRGLGIPYPCEPCVDFETTLQSKRPWLLLQSVKEYYY